MCPIHGAQLTITKTRLCRSREPFRRAYLDGHGRRPKAIVDPEVKNRRRRDAERLRELREAVCVKCGEKQEDGQPAWNSAGFCRLLASSGCSMTEKFHDTYKRCKHWPE